MSKQVTIDTEECIGCQSCVELCPEVFGFNVEEDKAFVFNPDGGDIECVEDAASSCPVECISIAKAG
jgi:ferredoxin